MSQLSNITAVILAGGLGTRLRGVVADRPKVLAEVNHRPFLEYLLDQLASNGIKRTVLCTGYLGDKIERAYGENYLTMQLRYSREKAPLGTGGALRLALPLLDTDPVLVLNGDSFCSLDYRDFLEFHLKKLASISVCLADVADVSRYGAVQTDGCGNIVQFKEKDAHSGFGSINAGLYLINRTVIEKIPPARIVSLEKEVIPTIIGAGLCGFHSQGEFIDIGIPADYEASQRFFQAPGKETKKP